MAPENAYVIEPAPELDMASAPDLGAAVIDALARGESKLIVDFASVRLIDSAGIGILLSAERRVRAAGGEMVVANASEHVEKVFKLTGVGRSLTLVSGLTQGF